MTMFFVPQRVPRRESFDLKGVMKITLPKPAGRGSGLSARESQS